MKTQIAILPHKHIRFAGSLIGMAGYVRKLIENPVSVDGLWALIEGDEHPIFKISFTQLVFSLDILYSIKQIDIDNDGLIHQIKSRNETN